MLTAVLVQRSMITDRFSINAHRWLTTQSGGHCSAQRPSRLQFPSSYGWVSPQCPKVEITMPFSPIFLSQKTQSSYQWVETISIRSLIRVVLDTCTASRVSAGRTGCWSLDACLNGGDRRLAAWGPAPGTPRAADVDGSRTLGLGKRRAGGAPPDSRRLPPRGRCKEAPASLHHGGECSDPERIWARMTQASPGHRLEVMHSVTPSDGPAPWTCPPTPV